MELVNPGVRCIPDIQLPGWLAGCRAQNVERYITCGSPRQAFEELILGLLLIAVKDACFTFMGSDSQLDKLCLRSSSSACHGCHNRQVQVVQWHFHIV